MTKVDSMSLTFQHSQGDKTNTAVATWSCSAAYVDHYEYGFSYRTTDTRQVSVGSSQGVANSPGAIGGATTAGEILAGIAGATSTEYIWYGETTSTTTGTVAEYSIPEVAYGIKCWVKPISKTHEVKITTGKGKKKKTRTETRNYFTGGRRYRRLDVTDENFTPSLPSQPSLTVKDDTGNLRAEASRPDNLTDRLEFQFYRPEQNGTYGEYYTVPVAVDANGNAAVEISPKYAGYMYFVQVRGINDNIRNTTLWGPWSSYSAEVVTKPPQLAPPSAIIADEVNALLTVRVVKPYGVRTCKVQYTDRQDMWSGDNVTEKMIEADYDSVSFTVDPGKKYWVRAKGINKNNLEGPYSNSVQVIVGRKPQPPTTWSSRMTAKIGQSVILYWVHNTVDGSAQTLAQVEINANGQINVYDIYPKNDPSTGQNSNKGDYSLDTSSYPDQTKVRWRVRTRGISDKWSDWSTQREISVYTPPTLNVNVYQSVSDESAPVSIVESFPFYIRATGGPLTQRAIGFYISITANGSYDYTAPDGTTQTVFPGQQVYSEFFDFSSSDETVKFDDYATIKDNTLTLEVSADKIDLEPGINYTISSAISMNTGLEASAQKKFSVEWSDQEYEPDCSFIYNDDTLEMLITPYCRKPANFDPSVEYPDWFVKKYEYVKDVTLNVYRREYNGELKLVSANIPNDGKTVVVDPHPSLRVAMYRIAAIHTKTGAVTYYDPPGYPIYQTDIVIQWDEVWYDLNLLETAEEEYDTGDEPAWSGSMLRFPYNIDTSESTSPDVALIKPIGRKRPISHYGTQLSETATWNTEFPKYDIDGINLIRRLQVWPGDVYVREPSGTGYWANVTVSFNLTHLELVVPVTINVTRVEGGL